VTVFEQIADIKKSAEGAKPGFARENAVRIVRLAVGGALFVAALVMDKAFHLSGWISLPCYVAAYLVSGADVVIRAARNIVRGHVFDECFLMALASLCAFALGEYPEAAAVMLFYQVGEYFQSLAVGRSKRSIAALMDIRPDYANLLCGEGEARKVSPEDVTVGDQILVKPGEKIPLDGVIVEGNAILDTKALTGESAPRRATKGDAVLSGCVAMDGLLTVRVTKPFGESTAAKIIDLVEHAASRKAPTEHFITTFSRYYTPAVVGVALLLAVVPPLAGLALGTGAASDWQTWINRGLVFLVASCPCALVISVPLGFFGGIGRASKRGILVKGGNFLEALARLDTVAFDKTGTLTKGVFEVTGVSPAEGFTRDKVLELAVKAERFSNHPIAKAIRNAASILPDETRRLSEYKELRGMGVSVHDGEDWILAGNEELFLRHKIPLHREKNVGTVVSVSLNGTYAGTIRISDQVKSDSTAAIRALKERGVRKTVMLSGDDPALVEAVRGELGLDAAFGGLLPDQKVEKIEALEADLAANTERGRFAARGKIAFVGDGVNDAPVLARADVGIAMGGLGSDAAIEAADVVIMTDEPSKVAEAVDVARATKRIVWQNIVFALSVKGVVLILGAAGLAAMWAAVFADVGVALLAVLNSMRAVGISRVR
jgi:Cd2+/Zn2+-exporting ATPase